MTNVRPVAKLMNTGRISGRNPRAITTKGAPSSLIYRCSPSWETAYPRHCRNFWSTSGFDSKRGVNRPPLDSMQAVDKWKSAVSDGGGSVRSPDPWGSRATPTGTADPTSV